VAAHDDGKVGSAQAGEADVGNEERGGSGEGGHGAAGVFGAGAGDDIEAAGLETLQDELADGEIVFDEQDGSGV